MKRKIKAIILVTSTVMTVGGLTFNSNATNATTIKTATPHSSKIIGKDVRSISETMLELPSFQHSETDVLKNESHARLETDTPGETHQNERSEQVTEEPNVEEPVTIPKVEEPIQEEPVQEVLSGEYIEINGTKFYAVSNSFEEDRALAQKYGVVLYGLPNSCLFAFIKDGEIIFSLSTGNASIDLEYKEMAVEFFSNESFSDYSGIVENIKHVLETGEEVDIMLEDYIGYYISKDEERLNVSW